MHDKETKTIAVEWCVADVQVDRPDLNDDQAWHVLETAYFEHDADSGINWDVLKYWADYLYPEQQAA